MGKTRKLKVRENGGGGGGGGGEGGDEGKRKVSGFALSQSPQTRLSRSLELDILCHDHQSSQATIKGDWYSRMKRSVEKLRRRPLLGSLHTIRIFFFSPF